MLGSFKPVPPLLKGYLNSQQLPVPYVVIPLCYSRFLGEKGTWEQLWGFTLTL